MIHHKNETENMLSSLDSLAEKISPGSGTNSPNQQPPDTMAVQTTIIAPATTATNTTTTNSIGNRTHFSQSLHPYHKLEQNNNNNTCNSNHNHSGSIVRAM